MLSFLQPSFVRHTDRNYGNWSIYLNPKVFEMLLKVVWSCKKKLSSPINKEKHYETLVRRTRRLYTSSIKHWMNQLLKYCNHKYFKTSMGHSWKCLLRIWQSNKGMTLSSSWWYWGITYVSFWIYFKLFL